MANEGDAASPLPGRGVQERPKLGDQRIAAVFEVEFEPLRRMDRCTSRRPAVPPGKGQRRVFEQEEPANSSADLAGDPEALPVAADEKCRNRFVEDAGFKRKKRRRD